MCSSAPSLEEVKEAWNANAAGFEEELCATDEIAREFRNSLITARAFVARFEGPLVASGMFNEIRNGITEISGVSTLPAFRRRGFAANLTTAMARAAFAEGAQVTFLTAMSDAAARVYARIGYTAIGNLLKYGES
jgi:predicted GNAT family acetyltransferase